MLKIAQLFNSNVFYALFKQLLLGPDIKLLIEHLIEETSRIVIIKFVLWQFYIWFCLTKYNH